MTLWCSLQQLPTITHCQHMSQIELDTKDVHLWALVTLVPWIAPFSFCILWRNGGDWHSWDLVWMWEGYFDFCLTLFSYKREQAEEHSRRVLGKKSTVHHAFLFGKPRVHFPLLTLECGRFYFQQPRQSPPTTLGNLGWFCTFLGISMQHHTIGNPNNFTCDLATRKGLYGSLPIPRYVS